MRVTRISELGTTLAVTSNRRTILLSSLLLETLPFLVVAHKEITFRDNHVHLPLPISSITQWKSEVSGIGVYINNPCLF
jgi:hypothetical protein